MKNDWNNRTLGDIASFINGDRGRNYPSVDDFTDSGVPFINAGHIQQGRLDFSDMNYISEDKFDSLHSGKINPGDILFCLRGSLGKSAVSTIDKGAIASSLVIIRPKSDNPQFIQYYLQSNRVKKYILQNNNGSSQPNLSVTSVSRFSISIPSISEQERIVAELDLLTGIIDKQKAQLKELDNLAQSIFYDMFGDPVENEKGWQTVRVGSICKDVSYGTSSPASESGKFIYLRMNNITYQGELDLGNVKYIDLSDEDFEKYSVREGDVLFNRTNSADLVGKTTWFHGLPPMVIAGYIIRIRLDSAVFPVYFSSFMNTKGMKILLKAMGKGAVNQSNINAKELRSIILPLPPLALQESFAQKIESIESQKVAINRSIAETQKLFDYTMDKYFG